MLDTSRVKDALNAAKAHAKAIGLTENLNENLTFLDGFAGRDNTRCTLHHDFAPHSFGFVLERQTKEGWKHLLTGGLLFHGPHDGNGSGASPTYAVTTTPTRGWSIHT